MQRRAAIGLFLFLWGAFSVHLAQCQQVTFDYRIQAVRMFQLDPETNDRRPVQSLQPYLYDIGPAPYFQFEIDVAQFYGKSPLAGYVDVSIECYILLRPRDVSIYDGLENEYPNAPDALAWSYHGPVKVEFSRSNTNDVVRLTSTPHQFAFLDPENPITFARPLDYAILGFAYRFALIPSALHLKDQNPSDNAAQLTFLRP